MTKYGAKQEEDESGAPYGIEDDRHERQPKDDGTAPKTAKQMESQHGGRQKDEEEPE